MAPVTPQKPKGSMGPPATPSSSSSSKALVLSRSSTPVTPISRRLLPSPSSSPSPAPSSSYRLGTPLTVKEEPVDVPSRSASVKRELTPSPSPSSPSPLRQRLNILSRASASPYPSVRRGSRASSVSSELSMSSIGSRRRSPFRIGTQDFDPRPKQRTNRVREGDTPAAAPANTPPVKPFPVSLEKAVRALTTVFGGWLPAEEAVGMVDLQKRCWDVISNRLLREGMADVSKSIAGELKDLDKGPRAPAVEDFVAELRRFSSMIVLAAISEYPIEGSKTKTLAARRLVWYSQYQDSLPLARAQATADISSFIATKLLSFLSEEWLKRMDSLAADIRPHVEAVSRLDCRAVVEGVRKVADVVVEDIWGTK